MKNRPLSEITAEAREALSPEPYTGRRYLCCGRCGGQGEVNGSGDDPRWVPCDRCEGTGLGPKARPVLTLLAELSGRLDGADHYRQALIVIRHGEPRGDYRTWARKVAGDALCGRPGKKESEEENE